VIDLPVRDVRIPDDSGEPAVRRQVRPTDVLAHGRVVASTPPAVTTLSWPGEEPTAVTFVPHATSTH